MARSPKRCVYCGKPETTKEHFRGKWSIPLAPKHKRSEHFVAKPDSDFSNVLSAPERGAGHRPGTPRAQTLKIACKSCNSGWMSMIQKNAIPVLTDLNYGVWGNISLNYAPILSRWITLFTMSYEQLDYASAAVDYDERQRFALTSDPGPDWRIAIGIVDTESWGDATYHRTFGLPVEIEFDGNRLMQLTAGTLGRFLFLSFYSAFHLPIDFAREARRHGMIPIWPESPTSLDRPLRVHRDGIVKVLIDDFSERIIHPFDPRFG